MKTILILLVTGLITGFIISFVFNSKENSFSEIKIGEDIWKIEVVSSLNDRIKGLSGRESLEKQNGMLFIFPKEDYHSIWMKEMNFSIDIIWISKDLKIVDFKKRVSPDSYPDVFKPSGVVKYVLEVNVGEIRESIKFGDLVEIF